MKHELYLDIHGKALKLSFERQTHLERYMREFEHYEYFTSTKLQQIYKNLFNFDTQLFSAIRLYVKVSKKYFHIIYDGEEFNSINEIQFNVNSLSKI